MIVIAPNYFTVHFKDHLMEDVSHDDGDTEEGRKPLPIFQLYHFYFFSNAIRSN